MYENSGGKQANRNNKFIKPGNLKANPRANNKITEIIYDRNMFIADKFRASTIAFVSGIISSDFIPTVTRGVEEQISKLGKEKHSLIFQSPRNGTPEEAGNEISDIIRKKSADGIIVLSITPGKKVIDSIIKSKMPVVFIERQIQGISSVKVDNFRGGFLAAIHLVQAGRKKPGVIIDSYTANRDSAEYERLLGFKAGLNSCKISLSGENIVKAQYNNIESGRICLDKLGIKIRKIDSIFSVAGDTVAIGFMIEAKSHGIKIPRDIAVIGFDDMDVAAAVEPALTTIRQPITGMGKEAVNIIDGALKGKLVLPKYITLDAELIIRNSV